MASLHLISKLLSPLPIVALLAGCSGTHNGAVPQVTPAASRAHRTSSGSSGDLLYAATQNAIVILSYPKWGVVAKIPGAFYFVCSDPNTGNVFAIGDTQIVEYTHGGTTPIATLTVPSGYSGFTGCTVDATTGNLAVPTAGGPNNRGAILVYLGGQGEATPYSDSKLVDFRSASYDGAGNLYALGVNKATTPRIAELMAGHNQFTLIKLSANDYPNKLQWYGSYLVFQTGNGRSLGSTVSQVEINGRTGTIVNSFKLSHCNSDYFWIYNGSLISFYYPPKARNNTAVAVWPYPTGGEPTSKFYGITKGRDDYAHDVTVSVAPSGSRK
jgi:hypothetical protein